MKTLAAMVFLAGCACPKNEQPPVASGMITIESGSTDSYIKHGANAAQILGMKTTTWKEPSGDDCNSCTCTGPLIEKDGKRYRDEGMAWCNCTLAYCPKSMLVEIDKDGKAVPQIHTGKIIVDQSLKLYAK